MQYAFTDSVTGKTCETPWSIEEAILHGRSKYMDRDGCEICGKDHPKTRYVKDGTCVGCFTKQCFDLYDTWLKGNPDRPEPFCTSAEQAKQKGADWYFAHSVVCTGGPHFRRKHVVSGQCIDCEADREAARAAARGPRAAARRAGLTTYLPNDPCEACGTTSPRSVVTNACSGCRAVRAANPRAAARAAGLSRYVPDFDCPECGTRAERSVVTNACSGCRAKPTKPTTPAPKVDGRRTPTSIMVEQFPDMIVSREAARIAGFTQYRTGEPCRRGHTGWRYVSVGTCIQCARGEK